MNVQRRISRFTAVVAALATMAVVVSACGDGTAPITGENSVVNSPSVSLLDSSGNDITAINQANFPLAGALPLPDADLVELGAALPEEPNVLGGEVSQTESAIPTGVPSLNAAAQTDFFVPFNALRITDNHGSHMVSLISAIARVVISEYENASTSTTFSDETLDISRRIEDRVASRDVNKAGCDSGSVSADFDLTGLSSNGTVNFSGCGSYGYVLNGDVVISSTDNSGQRFDVAVQSMSGSFNGTTSTFDGLLGLTILNDSFTVASESMELTINDDVGVFIDTQFTGSFGVNNSRNFSGSTKFQSDGVEDFIDYTFADIIVFNGATVPSSGTTSLAHSDGSKIELEYDTGDPLTFIYTLTQSDTSTLTILENWANVRFRVPLR